MFWFGLILGMGIGGFLVAFYLNNIHSSKVKELTDRINSLTGSVKEAIK
jgi:hypothetical protein